MNNLNYCFCGSAIIFRDCCQKYIDGIQKAPTALALMKSRYSAYATRQADYLLATTHNSKRQYYSRQEILHWATANQWQKLEIISATETIVEFKAYFKDENREDKFITNFPLLKKKMGLGFI